MRNWLTPPGQLVGDKSTRNWWRGMHLVFSDNRRRWDWQPLPPSAPVAKWSWGWGFSCRQPQWWRRGFSNQPPVWIRWRYVKIWTYRTYQYQENYKLCMKIYLYWIKFILYLRWFWIVLRTDSKTSWMLKMFQNTFFFYIMAKDSIPLTWR